MDKEFFRALLALTFVCSLTTLAFPQADVATATVRGIITDPQGGAIPGATLSVKNLDQGTTRTTVSEVSGEFQIPLLRPGRYEITVEAPGFGTKVFKDLQLTVGQIATFEIKLEVAAVKSEVIVSTSTPLIEIQRTQQANTIENLQIDNLPNVSRGFTAYVFTLPGVSDSEAPRVQGGGRFTFGTSGFSIGGSNGRNNLVTLDGGENEYGSGQIRTNISPEAIQEFQVNRNAFSAEFGFTAGTAVNVITKSGTNDWRGSLYAFYRSQKTSARDPFDFAGKKAFDQRIYPGFSLSGPIARDKLFFFTNFEHLKSDTARFRHYTDSPLLKPSSAQAALLDDLDKSTDANVRRISTNLRDALTTSATTYSKTFKLIQDNHGAFVFPDRLNNWTTRIDYELGGKDTINGRFSLTRNDTQTLLGDNTESPDRATELLFNDYTTVINWNHVFSPSIVNQTRVQFSPKNSAQTIPRDMSRASLLIPGFANFGRGFATPFHTRQNRYQLEDSLTWIRRNHTLKFGASYRPVQYNVRNELWFSGDWTFSGGVYSTSLAVPAADRAAYSAAAAAAGRAIPTLSALQSINLGLPTTYRQGFNNPVWEDTAQYLGLFAQDSWKIHPRLTLDFGGRIDYDGEPAPLPHNSYFSPRLGFAWDVMGDHKTVLRGGGGIFYSPVYYQVAYVTNLLNDSGKFINQILRSVLDTSNTPATLWAAGVAAGKLPLNSVSEADLNSRGVLTGRGAPNRVLFALDKDYKNNYSIQASLGLQREIVKNLGLEVAYQMYRGVHIQMPVEINYRESATPNTRGADFGPAYVRIDPTIARLTSYRSTGNSIYHGMTVSLTKRYSHYSQFQINYTFSKTIDDQTDFNSAFVAAFPTRLYLERGLSLFDVRHNFVASGVFRSPFKAGSGHNLMSRAFADISLSPVIFLRSGIPFSLLTGADTNGDSYTNDRLIAVGRNTGIGPKYYSVNMRLSKAFYINRDSGLRVEFIVEGTNLFNHTNFSAVNDNMGADLKAPEYNAGTYNLKGRRDRGPTQPLGFTSAFSPRQVQFGLKIVF